MRARLRDSRERSKVKRTGADELVEKLGIDAPLIVGASPELRKHYGKGLHWDARHHVATDGDLVAFLTDPAASRHERIVVLLPKGKRRQELILTAAAVSADEIVVAGLVREGIKSAKKRLSKRGTVVQSSSGNHAQCFHWRPDPLPYESLASWAREFPVEDQPAYSLPGVFSDGRLDDASAMLIAQLDDSYAKKRALDLGCGAGPLSIALARRGALVSASDVDRLAVESTRMAFERLEKPGDIRWQDGAKGFEGAFDMIVTNPPFHQGIETEYEVTRKLIRDARSKLRKGGELWLVANRFLPWRETLDAEFDHVEVAAEDKRFRVYRAT